MGSVEKGVQNDPERLDGYARRGQFRRHSESGHASSRSWCQGQSVGKERVLETAKRDANK
jgi:hypothetical protein